MAGQAVWGFAEISVVATVLLEETRSRRDKVIGWSGGGLARSYPEPSWEVSGSMGLLQTNSQLPWGLDEVGSHSQNGFPISSTCLTGPAVSSLNRCLLFLFSFSLFLFLPPFYLFPICWRQMYGQEAEAPIRPLLLSLPCVMNIYSTNYLQITVSKRSEFANLKTQCSPKRQTKPQGLQAWIPALPLIISILGPCLPHLYNSAHPSTHMEAEPDFSQLSNQQTVPLPGLVCKGPLRTNARVCTRWQFSHV